MISLPWHLKQGKTGHGYTTALTYYLKIRALTIIPFKISTELAVLQIQTHKD